MRNENIHRLARVLLSEKQFGLPDSRRGFQAKEGTPCHVVADVSIGENYARHMMLDLRGDQYYVRTLDISCRNVKGKPDFRVQAGIRSRAYSRAALFAEPSTEVVRTSNNTLCAVERFSPLYLIVSYPKLQDSCAKCAWNEKCTDELTGRTIVVRHLVTEAGVLDEYYWKTKRGWENVLGDERPGGVRTIEESDLFETDGTPLPGVLVYNGSGKENGYDSCSAGELKNLSIPFMCQNLPSDISPRLFKDVMTDGASEYLIVDAEVDGKTLAQANNRLSQHDAPQTAFGRLGPVCWYLGKFRGEGENNFDHSDGLGYLTSEHFALLLSQLSGSEYRFTAKSVEGIAVQMRPATCKLLAWCVPGSVVKALMKRYGGDEPIVLMRSEITEEIQDIFVRIVRDKENIPGWSGRNLVLVDTPIEKAWIQRGDWWRIQFFTDLNGLKAPYDLARDLDHGILDISHAPDDIETGAKTSSQLLTSLLSVDVAKTREGLAGAFSKLMDSKLEAYTREEGSVPTVDMFDKGQSLNQTLVSIAPVVAQKFYFPLLKSTANRMVEGLTNKVGRLNAPVAGIYSKILPDPAVNFGVHLLKIEKGGFLNVIHQGAAKAGYTRGIGVKYPKQHHNEFGKSIIHDVTWYINQVKANDELSDADKDTLVNMVSQLSEGVVIIPAYEDVMHMLAGLDYDGDAMTMFLEEWIVDMLWDVEPLAVYIDD